ncbi:glycosyltransferase [Aequorivita flava]|uniref:Glycosyltransferase n=1 Tax=Aequorivita flava TaxID=3114371 RepID=A0AB35Z011_9FLAO
MGKTKLLFCGNALPMEIVKTMNLSVAGKKYEIELLNAMNMKLGSSLEIVSLAFINNFEQTKEKNLYLFKDKKFHYIPSTHYPVIRDFLKNINFFIYLLKWCRDNSTYQQNIILLNSSLGKCLCLMLIKIIYKTQIFSLTIDTPFPNIKSNNLIYKAYLYIIFKVGHKLLKYFDGIIVLNCNVISALNLKIPFIISRVGYKKEQSDKTLIYKKQFNKIKVKKIFFAGTLIKYNGIVEIIEGFLLLNNMNYELHLYGYGDLESYVKEIAKKNEKIFFHGMVDNDLLFDYMQGADLLINARKTDNLANDFGFPSKLIEYMLSGNPVLTTHFKSLPYEYLDFLHIIETEDALGIKLGIEKVFNTDPNILNSMSTKGVDFIKENNNWNCITSEILEFIKTV